MEVEGDYADVLTYLANLYSIKKIRSIDIDRFKVSYKQCEIIMDVSSGSTRTLEEMPEREDVDRMKSMVLIVDGIEESPVTVKLSWDSVKADQITDAGSLQYFLEILDKSTFRYF